MDKLIGLLTRLFIGKEFSILLNLLMLVPQTVVSIAPQKDADGKFITPFPQPDVGQFATLIYNLLPASIKSESGGPATMEEAKNCAFFLAKSYQYIMALFN